ncbi:MAG: mannose-1-phosphate guanylyltransferase [Syntrophobacterales bacterium]|jgi:mannose-1-phosphate guanylyltransferase|nr:mannose-1-phosphate guanylyltransferase [Syntrophobacterales bacterium]
MSDNPIDHAFCVIMAGGKGERFWPLSTELAPKPFLKLIGEKSMIQLTVERAVKIVPEERVFIILGEPHLPIAREQLPQLPDRNFIVEPDGRDTAPCVGFAAISLMSIDEKAFMITLPADHYVPDVQGFVDTVLNGLKCAASGDYLVTIGITPTRPETGYGYINAYEDCELPGVSCWKVNNIVEKPDEKKARAYLAEGGYYWNAGIFIWRTSVVLTGLERHMPDLAAGLMEIRSIRERDSRGDILAIFMGLPKKSIDYGLMEKADNVLMVPARFAWDDVGTWTSLARVHDLDEDGNLRVGKTVCVDTKDCVVYGNGITVATLGVADLVIVGSEDGVLVCSGNRAQEVKKIVGQLE